MLSPWASVSVLRLFDSHGINLVSTQYPFEVPLPNQLLKEWISDEPSKITSNKYLYIKPNEGMTTRGVKQMLANLSSHLEGRGPEIDFNSGNPFLKTLKQTKDLFVEQKEIDLFRTRFLVSDVKSILSQVNSSKQNTKTRKNQITTLLERIVIANNNIESKKVWKILLEEAKNETSERQYDTDLILIKNTDSVISWRKLNGETSFISLDSFDSRMSRIRKNLGISKR